MFNVRILGSLFSCKSLESINIVQNMSATTRPAKHRLVKPRAIDILPWMILACYQWYQIFMATVITLDFPPTWAGYESPSPIYSPYCPIQWSWRCNGNVIRQEATKDSWHRAVQLKHFATCGVQHTVRCVNQVSELAISSTSSWCYPLLRCFT